MTTTARITRMRALVKQFNGRDQAIVQPNEVFLFEGDELPAKHIAVPVSDDTPLGLPEPEANDKQPPSFTTAGYLNRSNVDKGRSSAVAELLS